MHTPAPARHDRRPTRAPKGIVGLVLVLAIMTAPGVALAHTGFESSTPGDQAEIDAPVSEITLTFSGEAEPAGEGFKVLDTNGTIRVPDSVESVDNLTWVLGFDEPLAGGTVGVRWRVQAPDAHPIEGSFSFTVQGEGVGVGVGQPAEVAEADTPASADGGASPAEADAAVLDEFLDTGTTSAPGASTAGVIGRLLSLAGAVVSIGGLVFAAMVMRGHEGDVRSVLFWVRRAAILVVAGAIIELVAQVAVTSGSWSSLLEPSAISDVLGTAFGAAIALRVLGGALLAAGARLHVTDAEGAADPIVAIRGFADAGAKIATQGSTLVDHPPIADTHHPEDKAWRPETGVGAFAGAAVVLLSFLFDGHTVTEGNRVLHAITNVVHVAAAAVWAGGLLMLALVVWRRHRRGADTRALQLAVRFSVVAALALVVAAVAGSVLAVIVLDSVSELWSTSWGRLLVAKTALVAVAAAAGGYNHKVLIPEMAADPDDQHATRRFHSVVTIEAGALALVVAATAFLVGAAS